MNFAFDPIHDLSAEFSRNQVLLVYLPSINGSSLVHLALRNGSFEVRDYLQYGSRKLRDELRLSRAAVQTEAAPYGFVRVSKLSLDHEAEWCSGIAKANRLYLDEMQNRSKTRDTVGPQPDISRGCVSSEWIDAFRARAPYYGLTVDRVNRVCQNLTSLRTLDSYGDMKEDSCVIFYFVMLDQWRQFRLDLRQRDSSGKWLPFEGLMEEVGRNRSEGKSGLSLLALFSAVDPYRHFMTFELQLSNNRAIGAPTVKANQADIVVTDMGNRYLYIVEAKMTPNPDEEQLRRLRDSILGLTDPDSTSVFKGFKPFPILLLDRRDNAPVAYGGCSFSVITWREVVRVVSGIRITERGP